MSHFPFLMSAVFFFIFTELGLIFCFNESQVSFSIFNELVSFSVLMSHKSHFPF